MSKLQPMDLAFFVMENQARPMHMAGFELFELPKNCSDSFVTDIVEAFRSGEVAAPFNQKIKWISDGVASWDTVEPDLSYHVRHMAVPGPGTMAQLYEMVSFLDTPLLDCAPVRQLRTVAAAHQETGQVQRSNRQRRCDDGHRRGLTSLPGRTRFLRIFLRPVLYFSWSLTIARWITGLFDKLSGLFQSTIPAQDSIPRAVGPRFLGGTFSRW